MNYDAVAASYDRRYARNEYSELRRFLLNFLGGSRATAVLEVGCGTGHWLAVAAEAGRRALGVDLSSRMLERARAAVPETPLVRATAVRLPLDSGTFDRVFCINALHHFADHAAFVRECHRVLRPGGGFLTVALDPQAGVDHWWLYDYFPAAATADRGRYPAAPRIRDLLAAEGFVDARTEVAQRILGEVPYARAREDGLVDRTATSQLMVISDADFEAGTRRLERERPTLRADLHLFATTAWVERR